MADLTTPNTTDQAPTSQQIPPVAPEQHGDDVWPIGKKAAYYTCFIAFFLGLSDCLDRQIIAALFPYLKAEYALSDAQLGSLMSIVNVSIALLVMPSAYFIDRWSRTKMMFLMGTVWSFATLACAFAGSFSHLMVARFLVGAGEAGYNPAAQSLLAASFPRRLRTTAAGIAQFGMALGGPVGLVLGAYIASHWGWRHALGLVAIPGFILSIMSLKITDFKVEKKPDVKSTPYAVVLIKLLRTPSLICVYLGATLAMLVGMLFASWIPSYFNRVAQFPITTASLVSAGLLVCSSLSIVLCGPIVDAIRKKHTNGGARSLTVCMLIAGLLAIFIYGVATPGSLTQIIALLVQCLFAGAVAAVGTAMVMDLTPPDERGTAVSLLILCQNIFGLSLGPVLGGIISDHYGLEVALLSTSVPYLLAAVVYFVCIFTFNRDLAKLPS